MAGNATARYRVTANGVDIDAKATAFEAEAGVNTAEVVGHNDEDDLTNAPATAIASTNVVEIEVYGESATDAATAQAAIEAAATAVGDVEIVETADGDGFTLEDT